MSRLTKHFMKFLLITLVLIFSSHLSYADANEEAQEYQEYLKYFSEGLRYFHKGQYDKAVESFKEAIIIKPTADAFHMIGVISLAQGKHEEAIKALNEFARLDPDNHIAYFKLGLAYDTFKDYDNAEKCYLEALKINPDYTDAYHRIGVVYSAQGKHEEAIKALNEFVRLDPDNHEAYFKLGLAYTAFKDYSNAEKYYLEALKIKPDYEGGYFGLGGVYLELGLNEKAVESFEKVILIRPDYAEAYFLLGSGYIELKLYEKAIVSLEKAILIRPEFLEAYIYLGSANSLLTRHEESIRAYEQAIKLKPSFADAHYFLASEYMSTDQNYKAIASFTEAIKIEPQADYYSGLGVAYNKSGQYEKAIEVLHEAIKLKSDSEIYHSNIAFAYSKLGNDDKTIEHYRKVLALNPEAIVAHEILVSIYTRVGNQHEAINSYKEIIRIEPNNFEAYYRLGLIYINLKQYEKAKEAFKEVIRINPDNVDAYYRLGRAYTVLNEDEKAIDSYRQALVLKPDNADSLYWLGFHYVIAGKFNDAVSYLDKAHALYKQMSDKEWQANALIYLGKAYSNLGKDIYATNNFQKAQDIYEELNDLRGVAECFNYIAWEYYRLSDHETALKYFQKAYEIYKQLGDDKSVLRILGGITLMKFSIAENSSQNYDETINYAKQAIEFAEKQPVKINDAGFLYFPLFMAYFENKDYETALKYGEKFLEIAQTSKNTINVMFGSFVIALMHIELKNYQKASEYFESALKLSDDLDETSRTWWFFWLVGQLADRTGKIDEAKKHYRETINTIESIREDAQSVALKMSLGTQTVTAFKDVILFFLKIGEHAEAFDYMERAKARTFLDLLGTRFRLQDKNIFEEERRLQFRINYLSEKIREAHEKPDKNEHPQMKAALEKQLTDARTEYVALIEKIKKENPEISTLLTVNSLTLKQVQDLLDPETTLLEYFITPDKTLLWVVGKSDLKVVEIEIKDKELKAKVTAFRDKIAHLEPEYSKDADELYDLLIEPAKEYIKTKRVGIVPHSVLHYLPFHALLNKDKFLIEEYEMFYTPSASVLKFVYEKRKEVKGGILAFGNPDLGDELLNLPYAEDEVKQIKSANPGTAIYLKDGATEDRAKKLSSDYNVLHFASHGELNPAAPMFSSIRLAKDKNEDGRLEVNEIFNLNLKNTSLVTLSACETGLGKLTNGDELIGLSRGFIYAGTPSIVASLWRVNDQSTSQLMNLFYENLKTHPKSESLRMAQLEMIRGKTGKGIVRGVGGITSSKEANLKAEVKADLQSSQTVNGSHPYFWAPFILIGDWK